MRGREVVPYDHRTYVRFLIFGAFLWAVVLVFIFANLPATPIMEDDPRWDCRTMGNLTCGPGAPHPAGYYGD